MKNNWDYKDIYENNLPIYLKEDIEQYKKGYKEKDYLLDCYWCEPYGSINSAQHDNQITKELADYLREKYLF